MKFTVSSSALLRHLNSLGGIVGSGATLPILECFLFEVKKMELTITGSDLETTISSSMKCESKDSGSICIPARLLLDTLKTFPDQPLTFSIEDKKKSVEILSDIGKYKLAGHDAEDFPKTAEVEKPSSFDIDSALLSKALSKTLFAVGSDDLRPVMMGVMFKVNSEGMTLVATDAHKLSRYASESVKSKSDISCIVPKKPLSLLKGSVGTGNVKVECNATNISFECDGTKIVSRLIDGKYPNTEAVIPKGHPNKLTVDRQGLLNSLRRVSVFSNKTTHQMKLTLKKGSLSMLAEDLDFSNEATEEMKCAYEGEDLEIAFNSKFLQDILGNMDGDEVVFELGKPNQAGVIKPTGKEKILMLIMPVMINN